MMDARAAGDGLDALGRVSAEMKSAKLQHKSFLSSQELAEIHHFAPFSQPRPHHESSEAMGQEAEVRGQEGGSLLFFCPPTTEVGVVKSRT